MNNDDIWLMSDQSLNSLKQDIKEQKKLGASREQIALSDYRYQHGNREVMRIHGPVISRPNWITELLGLRTTEEHLDNLSEMLRGDSEILIDIDTGGGHGSLAFELADMIRSGGDRVTAYSGGYAASAGMLFLTAAKNKFAHRSATLGSIGVACHYRFSEDDDGLYSDNAANKKPNKESVKRDINETEKLFHEYVGEGTGLSRDEIITLGRQGGVFTGEYADIKGFISGTTTLQELTSNQTEDMALATSKELEQAQAKAMTAMASRFMSMTSVEGVPASVSQLVACNVAISEEDGKALLGVIANEITASFERGKKSAEASVSPAGDDQKKAEKPEQGSVMALLTQLQTMVSSDVNQVKGDQTDGGEPPVQKTEAEKAEEDWSNRLEFMRKRAKNGGAA